MCVSDWIRPANSIGDFTQLFTPSSLHAPQTVSVEMRLSINPLIRTFLSREAMRSGRSAAPDADRTPCRAGRAALQRHWFRRSLPPTGTRDGSTSSRGRAHHCTCRAGLVTAAWRRSGDWRRTWLSEERATRTPPAAVVLGACLQSLQFFFSRWKEQYMVCTV